MSDNDWFEPAKPKATSRGNGRSWIWLLVGILALVMFLNSRARQAQQPPPRSPVESTKAEPPTPSVQGDGEWSLEELPGRPSSRVPAAVTPQSQEGANPAPPKRTEEGDWQLEEVPDNGKGSDGPKLSTEASGDPTAPPTKSTDGDWTIEELKPESSSN